MTLSKTNIKSNIKAFEALDDIFKDITSEKPPVIAGTKSVPQVDLKHIQVPDSLVETVVSFAAKKSVIKEPIVEVKEESVEESVDESEAASTKLSDLVQRLTALLQEAKTFLNEVTTAGMIGTNQKFTLFKKKKNGPTKTNQRNKS